MGLCGKAKWTGNLVRSKSSFFSLFALLVSAMAYHKLQPPCKQNEKEWKHWGTVRPAVTHHNLRLFPKSKCLKLLLPLPQGEQVGLGKMRTIPITTFLPVEVPLGSIRPDPVCPTAPTPRSKQLVHGGNGHRNKLKVLGMIFPVYKNVLGFHVQIIESWLLKPEDRLESPGCAAPVLHYWQ